MSVTHCSWHTRQDAATTQWPYGNLMLCGQAVYCALLPVLLFFCCSWSCEIETLTHVTRDLQIHRKSSIYFCHPWKTDRPDVIHRKMRETDSSGGAPHWTVIVHLFWICVDTWLRWIMFAAQALVLPYRLLMCCHIYRYQCVTTASICRWLCQWVSSYGTTLRKWSDNFQLKRLVVLLLLWWWAAPSHVSLLHGMLPRNLTLHNSLSFVITRAWKWTLGHCHACP